MIQSSNMWAMQAEAPPGPRWYQEEAIDATWQFLHNSTRAQAAVIAAPTGSGKTHIIAGNLKRLRYAYPRTRHVVVTHVKELVEQNANKFAQSWPHAAFGINAQSLKRRDVNDDIIFGSIQSMWRTPELLGPRATVHIDEAHLVSPEEGSMYQEWLAGLRKLNPALRVIGYSATIYRQKNGYITEPTDEDPALDRRIFTDLIYNLCTMEGFARLITDKHLSPLVAKPTNVQMDLTGISLSKGDFNQKQIERMDGLDRVTFAALQEALYYGFNRRSWLAFCSGVEHSERVAELLRQLGIPAAAVHSKLKDPKERERRINAHKSGELRCLVGNNIFTTGYDHPPLDMIIDLQPTIAVAKHVQKLGRAMRPSPATYKENGLVLDFAGNVPRCGPVNDPYVPKSRRAADAGDMPVKICGSCGAYNHPSYRFCEACGEAFPISVKIAQTASEAEPMRTDSPIVEPFDVDQVIYSKQEKKATGNVFLVVSYRCGLNFFQERIFFENGGLHRKTASDWWRSRHPKEEVPTTVDEALRACRAHECREPVRIHVHMNSQYKDIVRVDWERWQ